MKETKEQKHYYDMVEKVKEFNEEAAELLYFDVIFQDKFEFGGNLSGCFVWNSHHKGYDFWHNIRLEVLQSD